MKTEPGWAEILRKLARASERLLALEQFKALPWSVRNTASIVFWASHPLVFVFGALARFLDSPDLATITKVLLFGIIGFWGIYAAHFAFVFLPLNGSNSLYSYLVKKDLPSSHAILISLLCLVGATSLIFLLSKIG